MDTDVSFADRALEIRNLFDKVPCPLDIVVYTPEEVAYWREVPSSFVHKIFAEGYVVYDRATEKFGQTKDHPKDMPNLYEVLLQRPDKG